MDSDATEPNPRAVHDRSDALLERPELLREHWIEVDGKLGNRWHEVFPVVSESNAEATQTIRSRKTNQARLRLVIDNESRGYRSGRSSCRETPDTASIESTRSAGTRPDLRHFWTAWYRTPHFAAKGCSPPPPSIARSITFMERTLQLAVAIRQQPRGAKRFPTMQPMVAGAMNEREHFREALNARVSREHPGVRGRPVWLHAKLLAYYKQNGRKVKPPSKQTTAYWLAGTKLPKPEHITMLCTALGMTRGELFGETEDPRLALVIERWAELPDNVKNGLYAILNPVDRTGSE